MATKTNPRASKRGVAARASLYIVLLFLGLVGPLFYWFPSIDAMRKKNEEKCVPDVTVQVGEKAAGEMKEHSQLILNWSLAMLGALIGFITTTKLHSFIGIPQLYLVLIPAASLLAGSIWAAVIFHRHLMFLVLNENQGCTSNLNDLLLLQTNLFFWSLAPLGVFALVCLAQIVGGKVQVSEE